MERKNKVGFILIKDAYEGKTIKEVSQKKYAGYIRIEYISSRDYKLSTYEDGYWNTDLTFCPYNYTVSSKCKTFCNYSGCDCEHHYTIDDAVLHAKCIMRRLIAKEVKLARLQEEQTRAMQLFKQKLLAK